MRKYIIILEPGANNWRLFSPDVPGCVATGDTAEEALANFQEALEGPLELMRGAGEPLPPERTDYSESEYTEVSPNEDYLSIPWAPVPKAADSPHVAPTA